MNEKLHLLENRHVTVFGGKACEYVAWALWGKMIDNGNNGYRVVEDNNHGYVRFTAADVLSVVDSSPRGIEVWLA